MHARIAIPVLLAALLAWLAPAAGQQVVDRIIARVDDDILTLSELRELERFQRLVEGRAADQEALLRQLLEQWIVENEAAATRFPRPTAARVEQELKRLAGQFGSAEDYRARLAEFGLTESAVRRLLERQLYLGAFLDYRFRPAVSIEDAEIESYYHSELLPRLKVEGREPPPLSRVAEQIRDLLVEREISARAAEWLEEARARLRVEYVAARPGGERRQ